MLLYFLQSLLEIPLNSIGNKDIKSSHIGELILKGLRKENEVAFIRYASVYRKFNGVKDFVSTLEYLKGSSKNELASILWIQPTEV